MWTGWKAYLEQTRNHYPGVTVAQSSLVFIFHALLLNRGNTDLTKLILEVDNLRVLVLRNTSDVKLSFSLLSVVFSRVDMRPIEDRPKAGIQVAARKTRAAGDTAGSRTCAKRKYFCTSSTACAYVLIVVCWRLTNPQGLVLFSSAAQACNLVKGRTNGY